MVTLKLPPKFFDVDGTLISQEPGKEGPVVYVKDPLNAGIEIECVANQAMIRLVKEENARGGIVVVWSRGGFQWAENVIDALGLRPYVHFCVDKPTVYYDDVEISNWLKDRVFLDFNFIYRKGGL